MAEIEVPFGLTAGELRGEERWLRSLVSSLVRGPAADDVVQETWLAALRSQPERAAAWRPWLARIARAFALRELRDRARRPRRELAAARSEAQPSAADSVERLTALRNVADTVLSLAEPYRTTILLRYLHELAVSEVAERMQTNEPTVRKRVERGLALMRARLKDRAGADWRAGLVMLLPSPASSLVSLLGGALLMKKLVTAACVLLIGVGIAWYVIPGLGGARHERPEEPANPATLMVASRSSTATEPLQRSVDPAPHGEPSAPIELHGRVLDPAGRPLADVPLSVILAGPPASSPTSLRREALLGTSDAQGGFRVAVPPSAKELRAGGRFVTFRAWPLDEPRPNESALLVVAPAITVAGHLVDPLGAPIADAWTGITVWEGIGFSESLERTRSVPPAGMRTGPEGRFEFAAVPATIGNLWFRKQGYDYQSQATPAHDSSDLRVVLQPTKPSPRTVRGRVLDAQGAGLLGARVGIASNQTTSDAEGRYSITFADPSELISNDTPLYAAMIGIQPDLRFGVMKRLLSGREPELVIDLVLSKESRQIRGRVLGPDGSPWPGLTVYPWTDEGRVRGALLVEDLNLTETAQLHSKLGIRAFGRTDAQGRFVLQGMRTREYVLRLVSDDASFAMNSDAIGSDADDVTIRVPESAIARAQLGRIVGLDGQGIAGVKVECRVRPSPSPYEAWWLSRDLGVSGASGELALPQLGAACELVLRAEGMAPRFLLVKDLGPAPFRIELARSCSFRVELATGDGPGKHGLAQTVALEDARGQPLPLTGPALHPRHAVDWTWRVSWGKTPVLQASEQAATLILRTGEADVTRFPIRLVPGDVTVLRLP